MPFEGPAGPQQAQDWQSGLDNASARAEAAEQRGRSHAHTLASLTAKVDDLHNRVCAQEVRGDRAREQATTLSADDMDFGKERQGEAHGVHN